MTIHDDMGKMFEARERRANQAVRVILLAIAAFCVFWGGVIYVLLHFIWKYW